MNWKDFLNLFAVNANQWGKMFENASRGNTFKTRREPKKQRTPKGSGKMQIVYSLIITFLIGFLYYYVNLPVMNIKSPSFYTFIFWLCVIYSISRIFFRGYRADSPAQYISYTKKNLRIPFVIIIGLLVLFVFGTISGFALFRSKSYASLMKLEKADFTKEITEISFRQIPMLDEESANTLTNRKLGELSDLVSQFTISDSSAQINYKDTPIRVTYLNYESFFKWFANQKEGIPAYMTVDMVTQQVKVVRLKQGIKYSPSEYFNRNLERYLRFHFPTLMMEDVNFEIDEDGVPYWIASVVDKKIGLFAGEDIKGAVLLNAVTGEVRYYDMKEIPQWVDRVCPASLIMKQYDYYGLYQQGYLNSIFGQKNCTVTTDGYNYITLNDDVWVYTGITSISEDRGNIGFILVNQRTKESKYYSCAGAEEYSAMSSAQGAVQQYNYKATFPLLLNIADQPTYFMALKDAAGLVKMYAMVNVQQYQIVATGTTVQKCQSSYEELLVENQIIKEQEKNTPKADESQEEDGAQEAQYTKISGKITDIRTANIDGETYFYISIEGKETYFKLSAKENEDVILLNKGDLVTIWYVQEEKKILNAKL